MEVLTSIKKKVICQRKSIDLDKRSIFLNEDERVM